MRSARFRADRAITRSLALHVMSDPSAPDHGVANIYSCLYGRTGMAGVAFKHF